MVDVNRGIAVDGLATDDATQHIDDLQGGFAFAADNVFATVEISESRRICQSFVDTVGAERQSKTARRVRSIGLEGIARRGQQIDVSAREVVDEVEVVDS